MPLDLSDPIMFAASAAALCWMVIDALLKPLLQELEWWQERSDAFRGVFWKCVILAILIPWGMRVFDDAAVVVSACIVAVLAAGGIHNEVRSLRASSVRAVERQAERVRQEAEGRVEAAAEIVARGSEKATKAQETLTEELARARAEIEERARKGLPGAVGRVARGMR